ncbi:MAG TPA: hypothetical protein PK033_13880 [Acetivibrio sp.]|nr:hypothetical protein [Acetivibrio sp.]
MKVKVIKTFRDKYTKVVYQKGQEIDLTKERYEELTSAALGPFVEEINTDVAEKVDESKSEQKKPTKKKSTKK